MEIISKIQELENELNNNSNIVIKSLIEKEIDFLKRKLKKTKNKRATNKTIKYLVYEDFLSLISTIETTANKNWLRDKLIFLIAFECGLRASEVCNLLISDYNLSNRSLFCKRGKGSNNNTIRLTLETSSLLNTFIKKFPGKSDYIFETWKGTPLTRFGLNKMCKTYFNLSNLPGEKAHFHTLKHTCGVHHAELGLDTKDLQWLLGHKNIQNTLIYFEYTTKQQEALYRKIDR